MENSECICTSSCILEALIIMNKVTTAPSEEIRQKNEKRYRQKVQYRCVSEDDMYMKTGERKQVCFSCSQALSYRWTGNSIRIRHICDTFSRLSFRFRIQKLRMDREYCQGIEYQRHLFHRFDAPEGHPRSPAASHHLCAYASQDRE